MSRYDIVNGKWTFRATPLDYLHCIFNEYEWLLLLKGRNKPYESILDPLHEIARKERYEDEELADIKITIKWLGERLKVNTSKLSKWITLMYNDIVTLNESNPELFRKVTGLTLKDFSLLVSLNVFNSELMNDAVYKFKRYENDSLEYTGISTHDCRMIGGWDTVIDKQKIKMEPVVEVSVSEDVRNVSSAPDDSPIVTEEPQKAKSWKEISIGDTVTHKSLGPGTVMSLDEKYIIIKFRDRESKFFYPGAFEKGYLEC